MTRISTTKTRTKTTRNWTKKRKRTRTGSSLFPLLCALLLIGSGPSAARDKARSGPKTFAVIAGTTFRPPGLSLPGAAVRVVPAQNQAQGEKLKTLDAVTDGRGEFAFRVPTVPMTWSVHVRANGYAAQSKTVSVEGENRFDLSFQLEPDSQKGSREIK